jgi:hypothetical protein
MYITMAYPSHAASVLAGNDLFRSAYCMLSFRMSIHTFLRLLDTSNSPYLRIFGTPSSRTLGLALVRDCWPVFHSRS